MRSEVAPYYAQILILVDGWPWNLSEFDFRSWFAPESCPRALDTVEIVGETSVAVAPPRVSENRRAKKRRKRRGQRDRGRKAA